MVEKCVWAYIEVSLMSSVTAIHTRSFRIPSDLRRQARDGLVSTVMGDRTGILGAVTFAGGPPRPRFAKKKCDGEETYFDGVYVETIVFCVYESLRVKYKVYFDSRLHQTFQFKAKSMFTYVNS